MPDIKETFIEDARGIIPLAAANMASRLMEGDPDQQKAGYSLDNAVLAVAEFFDLSKTESTAVRRILTGRKS